MSPGFLLLFGALAVVGSAAQAYRRPSAWLPLFLSGITCGLAAAFSVLSSDLDWEGSSEWLLGGEMLHLRLDGLSALFLALLCLVAGAGAVYAREYWDDTEHPDSAPRGRLAWSGLSLCMGGVLLAANGLHFLIGWELFTVCAFFLLTLDRRRREVRRAGWLYLAASHAGTVFLFAFFAALASRTGSWELGPMTDRAELAPLFWFALLGFGVKAGLFPLHVWLPSAHASAPSHVSAILSGVAIKMGVYGLMRFSGWLPVPPAAPWTLLALGAVGALLGIAFALAQDDLKRLLAYCSVENVGIIVASLGASLLATAHGNADWGRLLLAGALLHVLNHGAFKALLFFGAGAVLHTTGTRDMSRLGGLWRSMPWTTGCFALGCLAVAGLPPLNGFVSEWLIYLGLFDLASQRSPISAAALPALLVLAVAGALALACFAKAAGIVFLGAPRTRAATLAHECGPLMRRAMLGLAIVCLGIGLLLTLVWPALNRAVGAWNPAWTNATGPSPVAALSIAQWTVATLALIAARTLWRTVQKRGLRRAVTWDCGYAAPTPRMQYTSGSFAATATAWFSSVLRPTRRARRPHGILPAHARVVERVPETVLEHLVTPAARVILRLSAATRRLQQGRLSAYILYLVLGLVAVGLLVFLGGDV